MHVNIHIYIHIHIHIIHICTYEYIYTHIHIHIYAYVYIYTYTYIQCVQIVGAGAWATILSGRWCLAEYITTEVPSFKIKKTEPPGPCVPSKESYAHKRAPYTLKKALYTLKSALYVFQRMPKYVDMSIFCFWKESVEPSRLRYTLKTPVLHTKRAR